MSVFKEIFDFLPGRIHYSTGYRLDKPDQVRAFRHIEFTCKVHINPELE